MKSKLFIAGAAAAAILAAVTIASAAAGGPTAVLSSTASSTTSMSSIPITATFSAPVTGLSTSSIVATNGTISSFSGSGADYTFDLVPAAAGTTTVMIPADMASSTDASSTGNQASNTLSFDFQPVVVVTPPVISNIAVSNVSTSSATITWNTDVDSNGSANYGTTTAYGSSAADPATSTMDHSVTLSGLAEGTLYHYAVMSGTATSSDQEFVTESTASSTPLAIDSVSTNQSSGVADNTFADGWSWTIHFTVPDNEDAFRIRFSDWGNASNSFATANDVEIYSPESSNASTSASAITETDNGYSGWIYLNGDTAPLTPGRQIDLVVMVKIPFGTAAGSYSSNFTASTFPSSATSTAPSTP